MARRSNTFCNDWLNNKDFRKLLCPSKVNGMARCKLCCKIFDINIMAISACFSHMKGSKHKRLIGDLVTELSDKQQTLTSVLSSCNSSSSAAAEMILDQSN